MLYRSVSIMIALSIAVEKTSHHFQAWGSVFSFVHLIYLSNPIDIRESHTCKGKSVVFKKCCGSYLNCLFLQGFLNVLHY